MSKNIRRVVFHSKDDLSYDSNLKSAESVIENFKFNNVYDINEILELYQIHLYFKNHVYRNKWTLDKRKEYTKVVDLFWDVIATFFLKIKESNVSALFDKINYNYYNSFWTLINQLKIYKKISLTSLDNILNSRQFSIRELLTQKNIVNHFSKQIENFLAKLPESAEIILSQFEEDQHFSRRKLFFPSPLSNEKIEAIIIQYLDSPNINLNYINLIIKSRTLKISDKTKLKAKRLEKKVNEDFFDKGNGSTYRVQVSISKDQIEPFILQKIDDEYIHKYSENWLNSTKSNDQIFQNFRFLFKFINPQGCINLVSKSHEVDGIEKVLMRSKNDYLKGFKFIQKEILSNLQLRIYSYYLKKNKISLEQILSYQLNEVLNKQYSNVEFQISFASENTSYLEKIRFLAPELEYILKQYKYYVEEGYIDFELINISSRSLHLSSLKSILKRKYVYGSGEEFLRLKHYFFSRISLLNYIEPYKNKYESFYQLLLKENIKYSSFGAHHKKDLDYLISNKYLFINDLGFVKIKNHSQVFIIGKLHFEDVVSFWHYSQKTRNAMLELENKSIIKFENSLFSIEERKYLNYYLNQREFSNGRDLRNKYLHGTNSHSIDDQENDYFSLMKLIILITHKIKDDLILYKTEQTNS